MTPSESTHSPDNASLSARYEAIIAELRAQNAALVARVALLERQLGLNIGNSGKPPSSDGRTKKPARVRSPRERSGKKPGGQKGHRGTTLSHVETPDATIDPSPATGGRCGAALSAAMATEHAARQVFDLPEPEPRIVTEHRAFACRCPARGEHTRAENRYPHASSSAQCSRRRESRAGTYCEHYSPQRHMA